MRIAVTGGIGEGKSTVLGYARALGRSTASADSLAAEVFADPRVEERIAALTGLARPLDRAAVREILASDEQVRRAVNTTMHPEILSRMKALSAEFVEVPLLIEACLGKQFDRVWVVTCGREEQRKRLFARYGDELQVERLIGSQLPTRAKTPFSDFVIRTNADEEHVRSVVSEEVRAIFGA